MLESALVFGLLDRLVDEVIRPGRHRLYDHLRAFLLEETEHVEVAVSFGRLRPEFAGDLNDWTHAQAIDGNGVELIPNFVERGYVGVGIELVEELAGIFNGRLHGQP